MEEPALAEAFSVPPLAEAEQCLYFWLFKECGVNMGIEYCKVCSFKLKKCQVANALVISVKDH